MDIRKKVENCGKTRAEICKEAGISAAYLSMIESGKRMVGIDKITPLADAIDADPCDLRPDIANIFS